MRRNGAVAKALAIPRGQQGEPHALEVLLAAQTEVRLSVAETDEERDHVRRVGWEERPLDQVFFEQLERRVTDEEGKEILARARCRRFGRPGPRAEPPADPRLERETQEEFERRARLAALDAERLNALTAISAKLAKAKTPSERDELLALRRDAAVERTASMEDLARCQARLMHLLQRRANQRFAFALAESVRQ